ncbi:MAG: helix-turn-helix domain-containing protein [Firmicutes bacterium]|nr:helix-turn-helix domain-containing protein [Bacillota bacterium]
MKKGEKMRIAATMTKEGYTAEEIAAEFDVSSRTIKNWRKKMGVEAPYAGRPKGRKDTAVRAEEEVSFLRPGKRPAELQFAISDEQVVMHCQSVYDCSSNVAVLKGEFRNQIGLPKTFKKIYWGEAKR